MNEDYFDLDENLIQLLAVACVNQYDETRLRNHVLDDKHTDPTTLKNDFLEGLCTNINTMDNIAKYATAAVVVQTSAHHPGPPIDLAHVAGCQKSDATQELPASPPGPPQQPERQKAVEKSAGHTVGAPIVNTSSGVAVRDNLDNSSGQVRALQAALSSQGIDVGAVDGIMGVTTFRAIQKYQAERGLPATGIPDSATLTRLAADNQAILLGKSSSPPQR
jgi:hypothetical protein